MSTEVKKDQSPAVPKKEPATPNARGGGRGNFGGRGGAGNDRGGRGARGGFNNQQGPNRHESPAPGGQRGNNLLGSKLKCRLKSVELPIYTIAYDVILWPPDQSTSLTPLTSTRR